jgi:hypothetical protein
MSTSAGMTILLYPQGTLSFALAMEFEKSRHKLLLIPPGVLLRFILRSTPSIGYPAG